MYRVRETRDLVTWIVIKFSVPKRRETIRFFRLRAWIYYDSRHRYTSRLRRTGGRPVRDLRVRETRHTPNTRITLTRTHPSVFAERYVFFESLRPQHARTTVEWYTFKISLFSKFQFPLKKRDDFDDSPGDTRSHLLIGSTTRTVPVWLYRALYVFRERSLPGG